MNTREQAAAGYGDDLAFVPSPAQGQCDIDGSEAGADNPDADYDYALTAIPGQLLRELYLRFGSSLLEANVRTFLGTKRPVNKGIVETLRTEPEHFLAFNNGLVLVCDDASFQKSDDGNVGLAVLRGLQIVNGGQTTSTIYFASRDDRTIDLSHVMVPAKIIIVKSIQDEAREKLISSVSRYANSQNAVKLSDLSANRPLHVQLEKLANDTWCPDGATKWFYERAAGAYNVMLLKGATTSAQQRKLKEVVSPKTQTDKERRGQVSCSLARQTKSGCNGWREELRGLHVRAR